MVESGWAVVKGWTGGTYRRRCGALAWQCAAPWVCLKQTLSALPPCRAGPLEVHRAPSAMTTEWYSCDRKGGHAQQSHIGAQRDPEPVAGVDGGRCRRWPVAARWWPVSTVAGGQWPHTSGRTQVAARHGHAQHGGWSHDT